MPSVMTSVARPSAARIASLDFLRGVVMPWGSGYLLPVFGLLYLVFAVCVIALYFPCRWFAQVRATRRSAWLSYFRPPPLASCAAAGV